MKRIKLTQGKYAIVDDEDFDYLNQWKWYTAKRTKKLFYASRTNCRKDGNPLTIKMHQVVAERIGIQHPDHINRDGLDNRRSNLREATAQQNSMNRRRPENNKSGFKGVSWNKDHKKWKACLRFYGKTVELGYFDDIIDAVKAYNVAASLYFGEFAALNDVED